jgi:hypothetical protein
MVKELIPARSPNTVSCNVVVKPVVESAEYGLVDRMVCTLQPAWLNRFSGLPLSVGFARCVLSRPSGDESQANAENVLVTQWATQGSAARQRGPTGRNTHQKLPQISSPRSKKAMTAIAGWCRMSQVSLPVDEPFWRMEQLLTTPRKQKRRMPGQVSFSLLAGIRNGSD